jgi:hypothetical protein
MKVILNQKIKHDYPKKINDLNLAWYNQGKCCVSRRKCEHQIQSQNIYIREMNSVIHCLWGEIDGSAKRDLKKYSVAYKLRYPTLRKRGNNTYSVFLMICHALIKYYHLKELSSDYLYLYLKDLLNDYSVYQMIQKGILKPVKNAYQLKKYIIKTYHVIKSIKISSNLYIRKLNNDLPGYCHDDLENKSPPVNSFMFC